MQNKSGISFYLGSSYLCSSFFLRNGFFSFLNWSIFFSSLIGDNGSWISYPLTGLNYLGDWDVENDVPYLRPGGIYYDSQQIRRTANVGDYFIVSSNGFKSFDITGPVNWGIGDWIIFKKGSVGDYFVNQICSL
mgnify:CR=1 FL=1